MPKYIVETLLTFREVFVVEAKDEEQAFEVAKAADPNWQECLGTTKVDINEYSEEGLHNFRKKDYFFDAVSFLNEKGVLEYQYPNLPKTRIE
jgi:GH35 family endo-1,4-beta-xylanase